MQTRNRFCLALPWHKGRYCVCAKILLTSTPLLLRSASLLVVLLLLRGVIRSRTLRPMWSLGYSVLSDSVGRSPHSCASKTCRRQWTCRQAQRQIHCQEQEHLRARTRLLVRTRGVLQGAMTQH